jgi:hypothetical protein
MKSAISVKKFQIVNVPTEYQKEEGCIAFQLIELSYSFYGQKMTETFDTKILEDGSQFIISGNGFIKDGFRIS